MVVKDYWEHKGRKAELTWFEDTDYSNLQNIVQVYGVLFNDKGEILLVSSSNGERWGLPGGGPESIDKDHEATLKREVDEEADVEIDNLVPIGYQKTIFLDEPEKVYHQLRYIARITKVNPQTIDPCLNIVFLRKFIKPETFITECPWGKTGEAMIEKAIKTWKTTQIPK